MMLIMINFKILFFLACLFTSSLQTDKIRLHIIPHSHDDVGWLKTMNGYYNTQPECVKCILDNIVDSLEKNKERTFVYSEMAFFEKWYKTQNDLTKSKIKDFIKEGRLEFVNGGWVMNDEACPVTQDIIDQHRFGRDFLTKEFNYTPKVAWQLDPFGHSRTNAYLLSLLGYENLVIVRIDYKEKEIRKSKHDMEFIWKPYFSVDEGRANIFTHITHGHYDPELPFYYSYRSIDSYSLPQIAKDAYSTYKRISSAYKTQNILVLYGDDFRFKNDLDFKNIELLMNHVRSDKALSDVMEIFYSTPSRYFNDIKVENTNWPELRDNDFFPYSDNKNCYWTGYFSSRPYLKGYIRDIRKYLTYYTNFYINFFILQTEKVKNINAKSKIIRKNYLEQLSSMRNALAIAQHHDAVSGTARENVSEDYISMLETSNKNLTKTLKDIMLGSDANKKSLNICVPGAAEFDCNDRVYTLSPSEPERHFIFINNEQNDQKDQTIRSTFPISLKYNTIDIQFFLENGDIFNDYDVLCSLDKDNKAICTATFLLEFKPEVNYIHYIIKHSPEIANLQVGQLISSKDKSFLKEDLWKFQFRESKEFANNDYVKVWENKNVKISFSVKNGFKYLLKTDTQNTEYNFEIKYAIYDTNGNSNIRDWSSCKSGAYMFAPTTLLPIYQNLNLKDSFYIDGVISFQIYLKFDWCMLKLTIYKNDKFDYMIESKTIMYPIKGTNKEYVFVLQSNDIDNSNKDLGNLEFFTDTNDALLIQRIKDYRFGWKLVKDEPVADNFYPINSVISIRDYRNKNLSKKLSVWNDRSQAGTSIEKGKIYLTMNRISNRDDSRGLADGVYENRNSKQDYHFTHLITIGDKFDKKFVIDYIKTNTMVLDTDNGNILNNFNLTIENLVLRDEGSENCFLIDFYVVDEFKLLLQIMNKFSDPYFSGEEFRSCSFRLNENVFGEDYKIREGNLAGYEIFPKQVVTSKRLSNIFLDPYEIKTFIIEKINNIG